MPPPAQRTTFLWPSKIPRIRKKEKKKQNRKYTVEAAAARKQKNSSHKFTALTSSKSEGCGAARCLDQFAAAPSEAAGMSSNLSATSCCSFRHGCGRQYSSFRHKRPCRAAMMKSPEVSDAGEGKRGVGLLGRRPALVTGLALVSGMVLGLPGVHAMAVKQGLLAGRIPGLSEPDENGWRTYQRPDDKSGGHGVGWSPIIPYAFRVPQGWEEVPVSIADLGGTEIDLRFASPQGRLFVVVAPVRRFADIEGDATIEQIGTPDMVISAFGPEVIGENVEGKVLSSEVAEHEGRKYYQFELEPPHILITATAAGNRFYLFSVTGNGLQWKRHYKDLKQIAQSFRVI